MRKLMTLLVLSDLLFIGSSVAPKPPLKAAMDGWQSAADTVTLVPRWTAVRDARGDSVQYKWAIYRGITATSTARVLVDSGTTRLLTVTRKYRFPLPGDSVFYSASVLAIDVRNYSSTVAWSNYVKVVGIWTPPPPPQPVVLDTVMAYAPADSISITSEVGPGPYFPTNWTDLAAVRGRLEGWNRFHPSWTASGVWRFRHS